MENQLEQFDRIKDWVVSDPEIMRGAPVYKGTRIPVDLIAAMLAQGAATAEILEGYPSLSPEKIAIAPLYMRTFTQRELPSWRGSIRLKPRNKKSIPLNTLLRSA